MTVGDFGFRKAWQIFDVKRYLLCAIERGVRQIHSVGLFPPDVELNLELSYGGNGSPSDSDRLTVMA